MTKNKGGAPLGNKNGEVWTFELSEKLAKDVLTYVKENERCRSLATACSRLGYYESLIQYLEGRFNVEFESIKEAKEIIKGRLIEQGLDGDANATMAIFILKNNHNMADKQEQKIDAKVEAVNLKDLVKFD